MLGRRELVVGMLYLTDSLDKTRVGVSCPSGLVFKGACEPDPKGAEGAHFGGFSGWLGRGSVERVRGCRGPV